MLLDKGKIVQTGNPKDVVNIYSKKLAAREEEYAKRLRGDKKQKVVKEEDERLQKPEAVSVSEYRFGTGGAELFDVEILNKEGESVRVLESGENYIIKIKALFKNDMEEPVMGFTIKTLNGLEVFGTSTLIANRPIGPVKAGTVVEAEFEQKMRLN
ncbi:MAG: Wzt carbohydrate-binding domain-containing protein [Thermodesulfobacteriota bacterium]